MPYVELFSQGLLWIIVIVEGILILALARQIGLLHERFGAGGARIMNAGPKIGETVLPLDVPDVYGHKISLGTERGKRTLLLFISTGCGTCARLMPQLKKLARTERNTLEIKLIAFGINAEAAEKYARDQSLDSTLPLIVSDDLALRYQVGIAPYGLVIDRAGILRAKGLINSYSHVESLLIAEEMGVPSIDRFIKRQHEIQAS